MEDEQAAPLLAGVPADEWHESWRLVWPGGRVVGHGRGLADLAQAMHATRPLARLLARVPGGLLERAYRLLSERRDLLARFVPDGPAPRRFP